MFTTPFGPIARPYTGTPTGSPLELYLMLQQQGRMPMGPETIDAQRMRNFRRVRPSPFGPMAQFQRPMPTPFPAGMRTGMGYAPPMQREIPEQTPAQWPFFGPPPNLPRLSQFMMPRTEAAVVPAPVAAMQPAPEMQPQEPIRSSGPVFPPSRPEALTPGGGMDPMKMALLAAGMRMLQSAGPSTQKTSLGQAIGAGGMEGLNVYNQQRHQQFQEQQLAENSDLRREQIESMRGMREAQAGELASKAEERQRIQSLMPEYQAAVASGDQEAIRSVVSKMYPDKYAEAALKDSPEKNPWSGITPSQYTPTSVAAYQKSIESGRPDRSVLRVNPKQTAAAGASVVNVGPQGNLTPGQKKVDEDYSKEYVEWNASGGYADVLKSLEQLRGVSKQLETQSLTGPITGNVPDAVQAFTNPAAIAAREDVQEVAQRNLRLVLGAQFTEKEGEKLIARVYNPKLSEKENKRRVDRLITQIEKAAQAKQDAAAYFEEHGTLQGWTGKKYTLKDFDPDVKEGAGPGGGGGWSIRKLP